MNTYWLRGSKGYDKQGTLVCQEAWSDKLGFLFHVSNLDDCPERATITRSLYNTDDLIEAINLGIMIAKYGFDDVGIDWEEEEE